mgnify:FL=1
MNEEDTSLYGKNREGKVALCETCAYDGYCRDKIRYYRCRNYIKIKDDYDKNEKNVADDRSDDGGSTIKWPIQNSSTQYRGST